MTADQVKKQLGNHKWSILVAFIMLVMVGFGYKLARIVDEGQSRQLQAHKESIAILSEENNALITQVNQLEVALVLAKGETQELVKRLAEQRKEFASVCLGQVKIDVFMLHSEPIDERTKRAMR